MTGAEQTDWRSTFQGLDNAALLALLPLLQDRIDWGKQQLEAAGKTASQEEKFVEYCQRQLDRAVNLQEEGHDVSKVVDQLEQTLQSSAESKPKNWWMQRGLFTYLVELETRRKWITDVEAPRRGLLPAIEDFMPDRFSTAAVS
ncbi:hypothetical protein [Prauserella flavalba]|uniref:hypothetical protein n=1 Tax=Prauserella flavalba TaxID=1477506 RepID=UPI0036E3901B